MSDFNSRNGLSNSTKVYTSPVRIPSNIFTSPNLPIPGTSIVPRIETLRLPHDTPKYWLSMSLSDYSRLSLNEINRTNISKNIILPFPSKLMDTNSVGYDDHFELGQIEGYVLGTYQNKTIGQSGTSVFSSEGLATLLSGLSSSALAALTGAIRSAGFESIGAYVASLGNVVGDIARVTSGYSPNNFLTVLMRGPVYKQYQLEFAFSMNTPQEAETLRQIVKTLNNAMAPKMTPGGGFFEFPKIFQIALNPNSQYLYKYKPAVLVDFTLDYTPHGQAAFHSASNYTTGLNAPESVRMAMTFMEIEFWLRGDYTEDNNPTNTVGPRRE